MKDLGERLGLNVDYNQKHVKDHTKPFETVGEKSPEEMAKKRKKVNKELKEPKKPQGLSKRKKLFSKVMETLNVDKIPGSR